MSKLLYADIDYFKLPTKILDDIADNNIVKKIISKLKTINIDGIIDSHYLVNFFSLFFILHAQPHLALVVLACAVGVERLVADSSAEDFFDSFFFRRTHFVDILRLKVVIIWDS